MFFGPAVNAARGIAVQMQGVIGRFAGSFQIAVNPQITKKNMLLIIWMGCIYYYIKAQKSHFFCCLLYHIQ